MTRTWLALALITTAPAALAQNAWFGSPPTSGSYSNLLFKPSLNQTPAVQSTTPTNSLTLTPLPASGSSKGNSWANNGYWQNIYQNAFSVPYLDGITGTSTDLMPSVGQLFAMGSAAATGVNGYAPTETSVGAFVTDYSSGWWLANNSSLYYYQAQSFPSGRLTNTTLLGPGYAPSSIQSVTFGIWYVPQDGFQQYTYEVNVRDVAAASGLTFLGGYGIDGIVDSVNSYNWNDNDWQPPVTDWDTLSSGTQGLVIPSGIMKAYGQGILEQGQPGGESIGEDYTALTWSIFDIRPIAYNAPAAHAIVQLSDGTDPDSYGGPTVTIQDSLGNYYCNEGTADEFVAAAVNPDSLGDGPAPTGSYEVTISVPGYNPYSTWVTLTAGGAYTDLGTVTLTPA